MYTILKLYAFSPIRDALSPLINNGEDVTALQLDKPSTKA